MWAFLNNVSIIQIWALFVYLYILEHQATYEYSAIKVKQAGSISKCRYSLWTWRPNPLLNKRVRERQTYIFWDNREIDRYCIYILGLNSLERNVCFGVRHFQKLKVKKWGEDRAAYQNINTKN